MQVRGGITAFELRRKGDDLPPDEQLAGEEDFPRFKLVPVNMFTPPVINPVPILTGFDVDFNPAGNGRPLGHLNVELFIHDVDNDVVTVRVVYGLRDWSGDWDDRHEAMIRFVVVAE